MFDELTPAAKLVGAINTIVNDDGYLVAITPTARAILTQLKRAVLISKAKR
ncbi:hypothetical protein ACLB1M_14075 [Escherichia coli]